MSNHFYKLIINEVRTETADAISVTFAIPDEIKSLFEYKPGQNITLRAMIDGDEVRRSYSICSAPHENELKIGIRLLAGGRFSEWAARTFSKDTSVEVLPPAGGFTVSPDPKQVKQYLAIAAGSGITPILSIASAILKTETNSHLTLLFGNRTQANIMFKEALAALKNRYMQRFELHHFLSRESTDVDIYHGRIDSAKLSQLSKKLIRFHSFDETFICGPAKMVFELKEWLEQREVSPAKIHYELFTPPPPLQMPDPIHNNEINNTDNNVTSPVTEAYPGSKVVDLIPPEKVTATVTETSPDKATGEKNTSHVTIRSDGYSIDFVLEKDGEKILDAALAMGADLPYSCKGGVCGTCRAKLIEGQVTMELNYALEPEEVQAGFILCCQSRPTSDSVIIDFD